MNGKVPFGRRLAFAVGDLNGGGAFNIVNLFYAIFLTDMVKLNPAWVAPVMLIARVYDAVTDPLMGYISDRTKSRFGRRRVYILACAPFAALSMFLMFYPYAFSSQTVKFCAALSSYILFATVQTIIMVPYTALSAEISGDYKERAEINTLRLLFSLVSSIACSALPMMIVNSFADKADGYRAMGLTFGLIFGIPLLITGLFAKESVASQAATTKFSLKALIAEPLSIRSFRRYLGMSLCLQITMAVMSVVIPYYMKYYINNEAKLSIMLVSLFATQIVALPFYLFLAEKTSKAKAYITGAVLWILSAVLLFFADASTPMPVLYALAVLMGFGISGAGLIPHTIFGDVADVGELKFGERREGNFGGFASIVIKVSSAVANAVVMLIFSFTGYVENAVQNGPTLLAMRLILCVTPLLVMSVGIWQAAHYRIDGAKHKALTRVLHGEETGNEAKSELIKELV